jgi:hypothetical protein
VALKTYKKAGEYKLIYSGDDALKLPEGKKAREKALEVAWETQTWPLAPGKSMADAVVFVMKPLGSEVIQAWFAWKDEHDHPLANTEAGWSTLARIALTKIDGLKVDGQDVEATFVEHKKFGVIASSAPFDLLGPDAARSVQFELGLAVHHRETKTLGKP